MSSIALTHTSNDDDTDPNDDDTDPNDDATDYNIIYDGHSNYDNVDDNHDDQFQEEKGFKECD